MPATGLQINITGAGFTPSGGSLVPINKVTSATVDMGGSSATFSGDGDRFMTFRRNVMNDPKVSIATGNVVLALSMAAGSVGTLTFTAPDARNMSGLGSATYTLVNASVETASGSFPHAQVASGSIDFTSYSSDGTTNPLSYVVASS